MKGALLQQFYSRLMLPPVMDRRPLHPAVVKGMKYIHNYSIHVTYNASPIADIQLKRSNFNIVSLPESTTPLLIWMTTNCQQVSLKTKNIWKPYTNIRYLHLQLPNSADACITPNPVVPATKRHTSPYHERDPTKMIINKEMEWNLIFRELTSQGHTYRGRIPRQVNEAADTISIE